MRGVPVITKNLVLTSCTTNIDLMVFNRLFAYIDLILTTMYSSGCAFSITYNLLRTSVFVMWISDEEKSLFHVSGM
jgi:hypothetical protein